LLWQRDEVLEEEGHDFVFRGYGNGCWYRIEEIPFEGLEIK
jgi:hypothetical protein